MQIAIKRDLSALYLSFPGGCKMILLIEFRMSESMAEIMGLNLASSVVTPARENCSSIRIIYKEGFVSQIRGGLTETRETSAETGLLVSPECMT